MRKSRVLDANKQVSLSSISKYNSLQKLDTLLESHYPPGKVSRLLQVQELRCRKRVLHRRKANVYHILETKGQSMMASTCSIRAKFQDLGS